MQLSGEMAIEFINANRESIERCIKIVKPENLFVHFFNYDFIMICLHFCFVNLAYDFYFLFVFLELKLFIPFLLL